ncbi:hypothetical protein BDZ91DRAFT_349459 [Kalaharituber pfeilii]|nr:hypothetical protein BDZ91DRAFT_349459 [Kalaharituber pfeilii]
MPDQGSRTRHACHATASCHALLQCLCFNFSVLCRSSFVAPAATPHKKKISGIGGGVKRAGSGGISIDTFYANWHLSVPEHVNGTSSGQVGNMIGGE